MFLDIFLIKTTTKFVNLAQVDKKKTSYYLFQTTIVSYSYISTTHSHFFFFFFFLFYFSSYWD